jgi:hypothetical protein
MPLGTGCTNTTTGNGAVVRKVYEGTRLGPSMQAGVRRTNGAGSTVDAVEA